MMVFLSVQIDAVVCAQVQVVFVMVIIRRKGKILDVLRKVREGKRRPLVLGRVWVACSSLGCGGTL